ncbi:MAG: hypothetical protein ABTQ32_35360 [Myxococcaceae bacterium]
MRPLPLVIVMVVLPACRSCEDRATDYAFDLRYDAPNCRITDDTVENVRFIHKWRQYSADEVRRQTYFYKTRAKLEACVITGRVAPDQMGRFVTAVDAPKLTAWWTKRAPILTAWKATKTAPRFEVVWKDPYLEDETRRGVLAGLQFASEGFAFSGELMKPFDDDEKPLRTLPATVPGETVGTVTVSVLTDSATYETKDGKSVGALTTGQAVALTVESKVPVSWQGEQRVSASLEAPSEVRVKNGAVNSDTEDSKVFNLAELIANSMADMPPLQSR